MSNEKVRSSQAIASGSAVTFPALPFEKSDDLSTLSKLVFDTSDGTSVPCLLLLFLLVH